MWAHRFVQRFDKGAPIISHGKEWCGTDLRTAIILVVFHGGVEASSGLVMGYLPTNDVVDSARLRQVEYKPHLKCVVLCARESNIPRLG